MKKSAVAGPTKKPARGPAFPCFEEEERRDMLSLINPIVQVMASPLKGTTDGEDNHIAKAIKAVWQEKKSQANIEGIAEQERKTI